jgi:predicted ATP-dependent serine protease
MSCLSIEHDDFFLNKRRKMIPACHGVRVGCKKKAAVLEETKELVSKHSTSCDRQLIQGMHENRSSPGLKVVKRNSEVIRD